MNVVRERSEEFGLSTNVSKTKTMRANKAGEERRIETFIDGSSLGQIREFKYLFQIITDHGKYDNDIKRRIAIARSCFISMKDVLTTRKLKCDTRTRLVRCYVLSI